MIELLALAAAMAAPPEFHSEVVADNPDLWYRLNDAGPTTVVNHGALGSPFNARAFNAPLFGAPTGAGDTGIAFDGIRQQYLESITAAPARYQGNPSFTAEAVVQVRSIQSNVGWPPFLHWGQSGTGHSVYFSLSWMDVDRVYAGFYNGGYRTEQTTSVGEWMHVVWVRDSAGGTNNSLQGTTVYVNGQAVALQPDPRLCCNGTMPTVLEAPFRVQRADDFSRYFTGEVDEVVLYPGLLSATDVERHYRALRGCYADCDTSTGRGVLDIFDFLCFQNEFAAGAPYACECDTSTGGGVCDIFDFLCFQNAFAGGCQ